MPVTLDGPRTTSTTTFVCDRCGKEAVVVVDVDFDWKSGPPTAEVAPMPDGWHDLDLHSSITPLGEETHAFFCQRACMSTWLGEYVKHVYGEEPSGPSRVTGQRRRRRSPSSVVGTSIEFTVPMKHPDQLEEAPE